MAIIDIESKAQDIAIKLTSYLAIWRINDLLKQYKVSPLNKKSLDPCYDLYFKLKQEQEGKVLSLEAATKNLTEDVEHEDYQHILAWEGRKITTNRRKKILHFVEEKYPRDYHLQWQELQKQEKGFLGIRAWKPIHLPRGEKRFPHQIKEKITQLATKRFPNDFAAQLDYLNEQTIAYSNISYWSNRELPSSLIVRLKKDAADQHPNDYKQQWDWIKIEEGKLYGGFSKL